MDVKPEMTEGMIEMATGICDDYSESLRQLTAIRDSLLISADRLNIGICGGGTHGFQRWSDRRIFPKERFHYLSDLYGYLAKQFTIFGQHVHVGCTSPDDALYLLHCMSRYVPLFIALSASSPFVQGDDTGFQSSRLNSVFAFPLSGRAPFLLRWKEFEGYFDKMTATGVVKTMKDFYWDIRPKPEYGTIEIRVMDTPLTVTRAAQIAAFIQSLARYLTHERPFQPSEDDYLVYTFNRFQACRFGFPGTYVDPESHMHTTIADETLRTFEKVLPHSVALDADRACLALQAGVVHGCSDADALRRVFGVTHSLPEVVQHQCTIWRV